MILAAAAFRILPHPPNFSPIAAMALFGAAKFPGRPSAFVLPLAAMFASDLILGLHSFIPIIYGCFALIVLIGFRLRKRSSAGGVLAGSLAASGLFFVITNLAVWALGTMYPHTGFGFIECFTAGVPFFWNTLAGDLFFTVVLFGALAFAEWRWASIRPTPLPA